MFRSNHATPLALLLTRSVAIAALLSAPLAVAPLMSAHAQTAPTTKPIAANPTDERAETVEQRITSCIRT